MMLNDNIWEQNKICMPLAQIRQSEKQKIKILIEKESPDQTIKEEGRMW